MLNKLFISIIILSIVSCAEQKKSVEQNIGINGKWVYIGWQNSKDSDVMAGGFVYEERYWEFLNSEITIYDNTFKKKGTMRYSTCLLYTSPSPRDRTRSRMPSSA